MKPKRKRWKKVLLILSGILLALIVLPTILLFSGVGVIDGPQPEPIGGDWRTWRGYSSDYEPEPGMRITFSYNKILSEDGPCHTYSVYDAEYGSWFGDLQLDPDRSKRVSEPGRMEFYMEDRTGDGTAEVGVPLDDGAVVWFCLTERDPMNDSHFLLLSEESPDNRKE